MCRVLAVTGLLIAGCTHAASYVSPRSPINAADLHQRVALLADDSMGGRLPGSRGNIAATDYIAAEFRRMGLRPAGDSGGYFQYVPMVSSQLDSTKTLTVNGAPLAWWRDVVPQNLVNYATELDPAGIPIVYGGRLGAEGMAMLPADSTAGKIVVYTVGRFADGRPDPRSMRYLPAFHLPLHAIVIVWPELPPVSVYTRLRRFSLSRPSATPITSVRAPVVLQIGAGTAEALFGVPMDRLAPGAVATGALGGRLSYRQPDVVWARNVVAVLPGRDSARRGEYVAIGAHNDHIGVAAFGVDHDSLRAYNVLLARRHLDGPAIGNPGGAAQPVVVNVDSLRRIRPARRDSIFNGADDDGAGTASLLAIARALSDGGDRPARSILFISHTGEEQGLLGSRWYSEHPTVPRDSIVAYLNMDLFGHGYNGDSARSGPRYLQAGGARRLSHELGTLIDSVNASLAEPMAIDYSWDVPGHPSQKYCRSDHASYARYGIPVSFFSTGYSVDYHQVTDEPAYLDYDHMARAATLVYAVALRVAQLDHRPVVDRPKPDPTAPCHQ
jgi:peptidase M28-like protein